MTETTEVKSLVINSLKVLLILLSLILIFGLIAWFAYGAISFSQASAKIVEQAWEAISILVGVILSSAISSLVIVFGIFILVFLVWRISGFMAQYEEFQPEATIVHQVVSPVALIAGIIFASPILIPYASLQILKGNSEGILEQAKKVLALLTPSTPSATRSLEEKRDFLSETNKLKSSSSESKPLT